MTRTLASLGEVQIIQIMERAFGESKRTVVGFGDDVSAIGLSASKIAVLKTDMFVGSTDLPRV